MDELFEQGSALVEFYRKYPVIAARYLLNVDLAAIQRIVLRDMWFKNYCITVAGRGFGKSQYIQSLTHIEDKGLVYLREEFPKIPEYLRDGEDDTIDYNGNSIYTSSGFKNIKRICLEKGIVGKELITQNGFENRGSNHHPLLVLNSECEFEYKWLDQFVPGDRVCIQRNQGVFGINELSIDDAYLIGLFIGGGSIKNSNAISITIEDEYIKEFCIEYCKANDVFYKQSRDDRTKNTSYIYFKQFSYFFDRYGVDMVLSYHKSVPYSIRTATREVQIAFLQGYFDTYGTVHNTNGGVSCCSVSKKLLSEIQLMILNFGIVSRLREKKTKSEFGKAYLLDIFSEDADLFRKLIGFRLERKQTVLDDYFESKKLNVNKDIIPYALDLCYEITKYYYTTYTTSKKPSFRIRVSNKKELTYNRLYRFLAQCKEVEESGFSLRGVGECVGKLSTILKTNYYFDTVKSVSDWKGDCYDFEMDMDGEPNYFTNGFINHNTFILAVNAVLHALLYPGYRIGLLAPSFRQCFFNDIDYLPIFTNKGLYTNPMDFYNSVDNSTKIQSLSMQNTIKNKWLNEEAEGVIIDTTRGFTVGGLYDHKILIMEDCNLIWKEIKNITYDSDIVIRKGFNLFGNDDILPEHKLSDDHRTNYCKIPTKLVGELSYLFGMIIGDGCVSYRPRHYRINLTSNDSYLINKFNTILNSYFELEGVEYGKESNTKQIDIQNKNLCDFFIKCGFTTTTALDKKIPSVINKSSRKNVSSFISGLMDTDGDISVYGNGSAVVALSTSSKQLAKEIQAWFLNFGIVSSFCISKKEEYKKLLNRDKYSKCAISYKVRITNIEDVIKFRDTIGFKLPRKKEALDNWINTINFKKVKNSYIIPNSAPLVMELVDKCSILFKYGDKDQNKFLGYFKNKRGRVSNFTKIKIQQLLDFASKYGITIDAYFKLKSIIDMDIDFVKPKSIKKHIAMTIDIEVENEHCYWAGGFINHNSKMIFAEVEKLYNRSPILREATSKRPTRGADTCVLDFKGTDSSNGSHIEALPIGVDGAKIRGSRFYLIQIDELAQMPTDIIDMVIRPMAAVSLEPMKKVREIERIERLIEKGLATESDLLSTESANKMMMTSSGYFKFNHMWSRMKSYWKAIEEQGKHSKYAVWQIPYQLLPKGFLDMKNVDEARRTMSNLEFTMEYEASMASDSEGFFKASLLESCTMDSGYSVITHGSGGREYIIGIDPNQGGSALFGIVVIELGSPNKVVYARGLKSGTTQEMTKSIQRIIDNFNITRIYMDAQGGGKAIKDLLAEGYNHNTPILDMDEDATKFKQGRRILRMINFSPLWISDANFDTLSLLENNRLKFPEPPRTNLNIDEKLYEDIKLLKSQMLSIIVTETARGVRHFDTPKKGQNKDLYSAIILAAYGAKELSKDSENIEPVLEGRGLVRPHGVGGAFVGRYVGVGDGYMKNALLQRKI